MAKNKSKPTLDDIAAHSGVSAATVSRVLNRSGSVSKSLVEKVKLSLKELGFEQAKTGFIAVLIPGVSDPNTDDSITGVYAEAERLGYTVVLIHVGEMDETTDKNLQLLKIIDFDAFIIMKDRMDPDLLREKYQLGTAPIIMLNQQIDRPNVHCIDTNRDKGMYSAVKYLTSLGHKSIAYLCAPQGSSTAESRKSGIERALKEAGLDHENYMFRQGSASIENGFQMTGTIMNSPSTEKPTAIVAFNDNVAIGCLHALNTYGIKVPEEVSVIGFDDIFITPHTNPPLTTVHQPKYKMGQLAVTKIDNLLSDRDYDEGGLTLLECSLVIRESTGPAKIS